MKLIRLGLVVDQGVAQEVGNAVLGLLLPSSHAGELWSSLQRSSDNILMSIHHLPLFLPPRFGQVNVGRWISI
jgi:hypothetical protein